MDDTSHVGDAVESPGEVPSFRRAAPGKLMGRGHGPGDSVHAWDWDVLGETDGHIEVLAVLPDSARNPRGTMFGGYTGLYVDLVALHTHRAGRREVLDRPSLMTVHLAIDYLAPITQHRFRITGEVDARRQRRSWSTITMYEGDEKAVVARVTLQEMRPQG